MERLGVVEPALGRGAIVLVEVPLTALGLAVRVHQQPGLAAHVAVEEFHHQFVARLRPGLELEDTANEAVVGQHVDGKAERPRPAIDRGLDPPFARFDDADAARAMPRHRSSHFAGEAAAIVRVVESDVIDRPSGSAKLGGEMAHRRQDERDLPLVVANVNGLVVDLHHQHHRVGRIDSAQRGEAMRQLVAEDWDEESHGGVSSARDRGTAEPKEMRPIADVGAQQAKAFEQRPRTVLVDVLIAAVARRGRIRTVRFPDYCRRRTLLAGHGPRPCLVQRESVGRARDVATAEKEQSSDRCDAGDAHAAFLALARRREGRRNRDPVKR